jgi:UDP-N-acetylglucosamine acyltransferase
MNKIVQANNPKLNETFIHPMAVVEASVKLGKGIYIGPFCHVHGNVELGDNVRLESHVVVCGNTKIGEGTRIFPFASIGTQPQDLKYKGEEVYLQIGKNNMIREHVTMNPGTVTGTSITKVGDNCLFMMGSHVAHDCEVGNNVILANNATLAGHVIIGDFVVLGGLSAVHQFVRIGKHAMIGGMSGIESDIIPYGSAKGERANLAGLNLVGLKRRNFSREEIHALRNAFNLIFADEGTMDDRIKEAKEQYANNESVLDVIKFISEDSSRAICKPGK